MVSVKKSIMPTMLMMTTKWMTKVDDHGVNVDEQQECELLLLGQLAGAGREGGS